MLLRSGINRSPMRRDLLVILREARQTFTFHSAVFNYRSSVVFFLRTRVWDYVSGRADPPANPAILMARPIVSPALDHSLSLPSPPPSTPTYLTVILDPRNVTASMNIDDRKGRFIFSILIRTRDSPFFIRYQRRINLAPLPRCLASPFSPSSFHPIYPVAPLPRLSPALLPHLRSSGGR